MDLAASGLSSVGELRAWSVADGISCLSAVVRGDDDFFANPANEGRGSFQPVRVKRASSKMSSSAAMASGMRRSA